MWMEAVYHFPLSVWVVGALLRSECSVFFVLGLLELVVVCVKILW